MALVVQISRPNFAFTLTKYRRKTILNLILARSVIIDDIVTTGVINRTIVLVVATRNTMASLRLHQENIAIT